MKTIESLIEEHDGLITSTELAHFLNLDEEEVRTWAREHGLRRIGGVFTFNQGATRALLADRVATMTIRNDEDDPDDEDDLDDEDDDLDDEDDPDDEDDDLDDEDDDD